MRPRWLLRNPSEIAAARLFCLPYSGCGASMYRGWPAHLGDIEICPVQPPGRENRIQEAAFTSYQELALNLADSIADHLDRPYGFFGHCSSALAAYETTVQIVERGLPAPQALFVSSQFAPQESPAGDFLELDDGGLANHVRTMIVAMGGRPAPELVDMIMPVLRVDVAANRSYVVPDPTRLDIPIVAIGWQDDKEVPPAAMAGWSQIGPISFHQLAGGHYSFLDCGPELIELFTNGLDGA
jgi:surfactin synthase thioesterase subunit